MGTHRRMLAAILALLLAAAPAGASAPERYPRPGRTRLATAVNGSMIAGTTRGHAVSADGTTLVFAHDGPTLNASGTTGIFARRLPDGPIERVSTFEDGTPLRGLNLGPAVSQDGRFVSWLSLDSRVLNGRSIAAVVKDRHTGRLEVVSRGSRGQYVDASSPLSMSEDGRRVTFCSPTANVVDEPAWNGFNAYVRDWTTDTTYLVPVGRNGAAANGESCFHTISGDGSKVAFWSFANNLVPNDRNGDIDVFVRCLLYTSDAADE